MITFTPVANFSGNALFTYIATDTSGYTAVGRVTVAVAGSNDAPSAANDVVTDSEDGALINAATLLANDIDPDPGDIRAIQSVAAASALGVQLTLANGSVGYSPGSQFQYLAAGQTVGDSFSYTMADQAGATSTATVFITVAGENDAPTSLTLGSSIVDENAASGTAVGQLQAVDIDQGSVLTYSLVNHAGGRFAVDAATGWITVANGALLDFETAASHAIVARATDAGGLFVDTGFTISLNNLPEPRTWTGDNGVNIFTAATSDLWTINGLGGNDILTGNASADTIYGMPGTIRSTARAEPTRWRAASAPIPTMWTIRGTGLWKTLARVSTSSWPGRATRSTRTSRT